MLAAVSNYLRDTPGSVAESSIENHSSCLCGLEVDATTNVIAACIQILGFSKLEIRLVAGKALLESPHHFLR